MEKISLAEDDSLSSLDSSDCDVVLLANTKNSPLSPRSADGECESRLFVSSGEPSKDTDDDLCIAERIKRDGFVPLEGGVILLRANKLLDVYRQNLRICLEYISDDSDSFASSNSDNEFNFNDSSNSDVSDGGMRGIE